MSSWVTKQKSAKFQTQLNPVRLSTSSRPDLSNSVNSTIKSWADFAKSRKSFNPSNKTNFINKGNRTFFNKSPSKHFSKTNVNSTQHPKDQSNKHSYEEDDSIIKTNKHRSSLKEVIEATSLNNRALSLISDTLELFDHQTIKEGALKEKYELIDKDEFDQIMKNNELFKQQKKELTEEYVKLKETYEKINYDLNSINYIYYSVEKAKTESITKIYSLENEWRELLIQNNKLRNDIKKEADEKNNIFRAVNEFRKKYDVELDKKLDNFFKRWDNESYSPLVENEQNGDKIGYLEKKYTEIENELKEKTEKLEQLNRIIQESEK